MVDNAVIVCRCRVLQVRGSRYDGTARISWFSNGFVLLHCRLFLSQCHSSAVQAKYILKCWEIYNEERKRKKGTRFILSSIYDPGYSHSSPQPLRAHQAPHPPREKFLALFYGSAYHLIEPWYLVITHHSTTQRRCHSAPGDHGAIPTRQPRLPSAPRSGRSHRWFVAGGQQRHLCGPFLSECC